MLTGLTPPVPDVRGLTVAAAVSALLRAGYVVSIDPATAASDPLESPGQVDSQSPLPGQQAAYGSEIVLTLTAGSDTAAAVPSALSGTTG